MSAFTVSLHDPRSELDPRVSALLHDVYVGEGYVPGEGVHGAFDAGALAVRGALWIAFDGAGAPVGTVFLVDPGSPFRQIAERGEQEVHLLAVQKLARRAGAASALMEACFGEARRRRARQVVMSTRPSMRAAQRFSDKVGFQRAMKRDWARPDGRVYLAYEKAI
jgi:ribosomal protein S18 acetylase RimI-like enzyme